MKRSLLVKLFKEARRLSGHTDYVIIGSLSILGVGDQETLPDDMSMSIDVDAYVKSDPGRIFDIAGSLCEGSRFHVENGYYLDPVSPGVATLPDGWEGRLTRIEQDGIRLWCLDPDDAAVSKYARSQPNDLRWIRAGIISGHISLPKVRSRLATTTFIDPEEGARVRDRVGADTAWFESVRSGRLERAHRSGKKTGRS
jgi:hypothetical protein